MPHAIRQTHCVFYPHRVKTIFTHCHANTAISKSERAYFLSYFIINKSTTIFHGLSSYLLFLFAKIRSVVVKGEVCHVAWLAEWHNYAECNKCRMTQRNKLNWKWRPFLAPINSIAAAFLNVAGSTTMTIVVEERLLDFLRSISFMHSHKDFTCLY